MNISQHLTRYLTESGMTAVLRSGATDTTVPVLIGGWTINGSVARGAAVFGPYPDPVTSTGVQIRLGDAADEVEFGTPLALPAGQTYRYTLTIGVE